MSARDHFFKLFFFRSKVFSIEYETLEIGMSLSSVCVSSNLALILPFSNSNVFPSGSLRTSEKLSIFFCSTLVKISVDNLADLEDQVLSSSHELNSYLELF